MSRGLLESFLEELVGTMSGALERGGPWAARVTTPLPSLRRGFRGQEEAGGERVSIHGQVGTGRPGDELGVENTRRRIRALQRPRGKEREPALEWNPQEPCELGAGEGRGASVEA